MLEPTMQAMAKGRIILASSSPARSDLIKKLRINVEIIPSKYDENLDRLKYNTHGEYVQDLAKYKVYEVYERLKNDCVPPILIIGADTIVTLNSIIYGKPKDRLDAFKMLSNLSNKEHIVYTGVCLKTPVKEVNFYESTRVKFIDLSKDQIKAYIESGEPLDKAGAYGVQGLGCTLVERIEGDLYSVIGMPLCRLTKHLNEIFQDT